MSHILTDFHSHILPGADHGSSGAETSAAQLALISAAGVGRVVATPHFYPNRHRIDAFISMRAEAFDELQRLNRGTLDIRCGAEVLVCEGLEEMSGLEKLCIAGTSVILLEMPTTTWTPRLFDTIDEIRTGNLTPVMAHVDRYPYADVERLLELGVKAQLNADSLCGFFGRKRLLKLVGDGKIVALGSDLHGSEPASYKPFVKACSVLGDALDGIMEATDRLLTVTANIT